MSDAASRPHMSFSQMNMYLRCSMQWYYRYVLGLKQPPNLKLIAGKAGHSGLEIHNRHIIQYATPPPLDLSLDEASTTFDTLVQDLEDRDKAAEGQSKDNIIALLTIYPEDPQLDIKPTSAEREFTIEVGAGIPVLGYTDVETEHAIFDYKFTSRAKSQDDANLSPQLTLYSMAADTYKPTVGFIALIPPGARTPPRIVPTIRDAVSETQLQTRYDRLRYQFQYVERATQAAIFIPKDDPMTCSWCGYRDRCQSAAVTEFEATQIRAVTEPDDTTEDD